MLMCAAQLQLHLCINDIVFACARYYQDIKTVPAISDQDMNAMLAEESRVCPQVFLLIFIFRKILDLCLNCCGNLVGFSAYFQ